MPSSIEICLHYGFQQDTFFFFWLEDSFSNLYIFYFFLFQNMQLPQSYIFCASQKIKLEGES